MQRHFRRLVAAVVLVTYGLPLSLGALADVSHGAYHVMEGLREREARAAALGLVHLQDGGRFVHAHGGATHSHAGAVDALLVASEHADEEGDGGVAPVVELSAHAPATAVYALITLPVDRASSAVDFNGAERPRAVPLVPPPRA